MIEIETKTNLSETYGAQAETLALENERLRAEIAESELVRAVSGDLLLQVQARLDFGLLEPSPNGRGVSEIIDGVLALVKLTAADDPGRAE